MKRTLFALAAALAFAGAAAAQVEIVTDEAALFGEDSDAGSVEKVETSKEGSALAAFLKPAGVRIGGSFSGSAGADWTMKDPWNAPSLDAYGLDTVAAGTLFFDARPDEDFRVFGKMKASYPFSKSADSGSSTVSVPNLQVFELFADWNSGDQVFYRFGKHTVKWGVGYFWSPADVINLGAIDPLNPTEQREGPVSFRVHYPVLGTQTNLWGYAVLPQGDDPKPEEIAGAAKLEFLLAKKWEIGLGGYYKYDTPPRAMLTASGAVGSVNLFGEATGSWGSEKPFVTEVAIIHAANGFVETATYKDRLFVSGTAGFMYSNSTDHWTVVGQYLFNGEGYSNADREARIAEARVPATEAAIRAALAPTGASYSAFLARLILNSGQHYAALSLSKSELLVENLSVGAFAMANLSDLSGWVRPSVTYKLHDRSSLELAATFVFGSGDGEYVVLYEGTALTLGCKITLGSGGF